ncbi:hypothetical protein T439DRAFT_378864 [Meredithblackwellia eburnea MCA 4105]
MLFHQAFSAIAAIATLATALPNPAPPALTQDDVLAVTLLGDSNSRALIDLGILAGVLAPADCSGGGLVGVQASVIIPGLLDLCLCVNVLQLTAPGFKACPACPAHAHPICGGRGRCGCECDAVYYATSLGTCVPVENCPRPNTLTRHLDGTSTCTCDNIRYKSDGAGGCKCKSPYVPSALGGCVLSASQAGRVRSKKSQLQLSSSLTPDETAVELRKQRLHEASDEYRCPDNETACPLGRGWECLDTTSALDSCGGCTSARGGGVNCLTLPGAMGVACVESKCEISSCLPGWRFVMGRCVEAK